MALAAMVKTWLRVRLLTAPSCDLSTDMQSLRGRVQMSSMRRDRRQRGWRSAEMQAFAGVRQR
jgi:hypothetical protein